MIAVEGVGENRLMLSSTPSHGGDFLEILVIQGFLCIIKLKLTYSSSKKPPNVYDISRCFTQCGDCSQCGRYVLNSSILTVWTVWPHCETQYVHTVIHSVSTLWNTVCPHCGPQWVFHSVVIVHSVVDISQC